MTNPPTNPADLLARLRSLRPYRRLSLHEAQSVGERQASLLLESTGSGYPVSLDVLRDVPHLQLRRATDLPDSVAGTSHWTGTEWLICLNASHPEHRQRFTAFHELHHILEHPFRRFHSGATAELLADHFSACVLMPRSAVKYAWASRIQDPRALADLFDVSEQAMRVRLVKLGLTDATRYDCRRDRRMYRRTEARGSVLGRFAGAPWYDRGVRP